VHTGWRNKESAITHSGHGTVSCPKVYQSVFL
jgi:hypothetical protein